MGTPCASYRLPNDTVQRFDGIRRVDGLADIRWVTEEGVEIFPVCAPALADLRVFFIPDACKLIQRHQRRFLCRGLIYRFQPAGDGFVILPRHEFQAVAHHMDDAELNMRLRVHAIYRFREAFQAVHEGDKDIVQAAIFQFRQYIQPELCTFIFGQPTYPAALSF